MVDCNDNNSKQAAWVALGSLFSFGFGIVSSMILSRYFDKGDYGTYKQVLYVYETLLTVFTLGLPRAFSFFLPRVEMSMAKDLINKITRLFFILGLCFSILLFVFASQIAILLKNPDLVQALKIFSIVPFLMLPTMGLEGILSTYRKNKFMTLYIICSRCAMLLFVALPVVVFNVNYIGAIIGFVFSSAVAFVIALILKYMPVKNSGNDKTNIRYSDILKFAIPLLFANIWTIIIVSSDSFFVSRYFGREVFAEFANGWMELPFIGMISGACATVLSPIFSRLSYKQIDPKTEIYPIWISVFQKSALLVYPILMFCCFYADVIMSFFFGEQYAVSGAYFVLKNVNCFFTVIVFGPLLINIGKVKLYSNVHMYGALLLIFVEYIVVNTCDSVYALLVTSTVCAVLRVLCLLCFIAKYFNVSLWNVFPIRTLIKILPATALILVVLRRVMILIQWNLFVLLSVSFVVYAGVYMLYARFVKIDYMSLLKPLINR